MGHITLVAKKKSAELALGGGGGGEIIAKIALLQSLLQLSRRTSNGAMCFKVWFNLYRSF